MTLRSTKKFEQLVPSKTGDSETDRNFQQAAQLLNSVAASELLQGNRVEVQQQFSDETIRLSHGLGRPPRGWIVVDRTAMGAGEQMWRAEALYPDRELLIEVRNGSVGNTLVFWVY